MLTVHLRDLVFHGYHGLYEGEDKTGNDFELQLDLHYKPRKSQLHHISQLISYEDLLQIVRKHMDHPTPLLEAIADNIMNDIRKAYPQTRELRISIIKLHAPIPHLQGKVGITLSRKFR